jgi:hypothetical protein
MHDPVQAQYQYVSMHQQLIRLLTAKQYEGESLNDYVKRFRQLRDMVKNQLGNKCLNEFIEHVKPYQPATPAEQKQMKKDATNKYLAYVFLLGCDQTKYGTVNRGLTSQFSLGQDQYPKDITAALDVLTNHKVDQKFYDQQQNKRNRDRSNKEQPTPSNEDSKAAGFAQGNEIICYCCGKKGHCSPDCDQKDKIPREQWYVNQAMQHLQDTSRISDTDDLTDEMTDDTESNSVARTTSSATRRSGITIPRQARVENRELATWSGLQFQQDTHSAHNNPFAHLRNVILLDTGSTLKATFMNPDMVTNIQVSKEPVSMTTNAGNKMIGLEATVPGYGRTWFDRNQIANIYGFSHMVDEHRITYDSKKEDAFMVHTNEGIIKFARTPDGLYAYEPSNKYKNYVTKTNNKIRLNINNMVTTVKENMMGYTQ